MGRDHLRIESILGKSPEQRAKDAAEKELRDARRLSEAYAAELLAARECPPNLIEWGRIHGIENFAKFTWQAGFLAGMQIARLPGELEEPDA